MKRDKIVWVCECGCEYNTEEWDVKIQLTGGTAVFRKKPCMNCKRPVQLSSSFYNGPPDDGGTNEITAGVTE